MRRSIVWMLPLALAACGDKVTVASSLPTPPAERIAGKAEPDVPEPPYTDEKTTDYMKRLRSWGLDCYADKGWLRSWFKTLQGK